MKLTNHPAADEFPMMDDKRYAELREAIRVHGQREPITLCEGKILDGRNRYRACIELGIPPRTRVYEGDPWAYSWDMNGNRRDLVDEQRYLIWKHHAEKSEAWQAERQRIADEANAARARAMEGVPHAPAGERRKPEKVDRQSVCEPSLPPRKTTPGQAAKAVASQTNPGAVARGDKLAKERPDLARAVRTGEIKPAEAHRQMKRDAVTAKVTELPSSTYRVLYADPPWSYGDTRAGLADYEQTAAAGHYPTMSTAELCALDVRKLADADAVLFCWATFPLLTDALEVVKAWGFKYKTAFVWSKGRANLGHYHTADAELLLVCTRGSCTPDAQKRERQVQVVERTGRHSEKPEHFRQLVDRMYPHGRRLELFRRGDAPKNWDVWGNEAER